MASIFPKSGLERRANSVVAARGVSPAPSTGLAVSGYLNRLGTSPSYKPTF